MNRRRKGHGFERVIAHRFEAAGIPARRGFQYRGAAEAPDVDAPPFWIECKRRKLTQPRRALADAQAHAPAERIPVAVLQEDRAAPFVCLALADFLALVTDPARPVRHAAATPARARQAPPGTTPARAPRRGRRAGGD